MCYGFGGAGVAAYFMLKRWSRAGAAAAPTPGRAASAPKATRDALDERLDRELAEIDNRA